MSGKSIELREIIGANSIAESISYKYDSWNQKRQKKESEWRELRNYIFATDTTTTTNSQLPWKNKTTIPKICQLRDNLHANYMSALFPNDKWFKWEAATKDDALYGKRKAIEAYMAHKLRDGEFKKVVSRLLYDYIDYGNVIADVEFVKEVSYDPATGDEIVGFVGPRAVRVSPLDIVFNPTAASFKDTPKITRYIKSIGELKRDAMENPEMGYNMEIIQKAEEARSRTLSYAPADIAKSDGYVMDGFDTIHDYYESGYIEILEFEGDISDEEGNFLPNQIVTVIDRAHVIRMVTNPSWLGRDSKCHAPWRMRPDNLYGMGPLDNLVGMQYRIDHLENIKADLFDMIAHPPLKIKGNVEPFDWEPFVQIDVGDDGDVEVLRIDGTALQADTQIAILESKMEEMAGAPKQAMGIRTQGEKTAYEVQSLENAASRIFQEKIRQFEIFVIEPLLNNMLEIARRNMDGSDIIRIMDDDIGVLEFMTLTKDDITGQGKLYPRGATHFAARNQLIQNVTGVFSSGIAQFIAPHVSAKAIARMVEEAFGLERFGIVQDNVAVVEQAETQQMVQTIQRQLQSQDMIGPAEMGDMRPEGM